MKDAHSCGKKNENFELFLLAGTTALVFLLKNIFDNLFYAWLVRLLERYFGVSESEFFAAATSVAFPVIGAIAVVWILHRYITRQFERRNLEIVRTLEQPGGEDGHYRAFITVKNSSRYEKMLNCRCEIVELRDSAGEILLTHVGLRTANQENKELKGRFYLDQDATKDIPVFDIDQQYDEGLIVINADYDDLKFEHGVYYARIRAYGDKGPPDEVAVRVNTSNAEFDLVAAFPKASVPD